MQTLHHILLPSFMRKAIRAFELKALVRSTGCRLSRVGRSRHWRISATRAQMTAIISIVRDSEEQTWQWLVKVIEKERGSFTDTEILNLVKDKPAISVTELVILASCTIAEARTAIDDFEFSE